ncbi:MAG: hemolysin family protein [Bryobacteraceae bacterium]
MADQPLPYFGFRLLLLALILAVNAFFAAAEVSLLSVRESRLRQLAEQGQAGARVALSLLAQPEKLLSVTQIGVTLASLGLGWAGESTLYHLFLNLFNPVITKGTSVILHAASFALAFLLMTYCHVVIGEVVPKNLAIEKADRLAVTVAPVLMIFYRISSIFVFVIERSAFAITRALGVRRRHRGGGHSAEELRLIVTSSHASGLPQPQVDMIHRVLDLDELSVREIMIPRNSIVSVPIESSIDQVLQTMIDQRHSRLPVYEGRPEQIVGVLNYKDLLPVWQERRAAIQSRRTPRVFRVRPLMRKHIVVPETKPLVQMLEEFRKGHSHMAIVVDEFGTISGLLTIEDVLEQIVGEIEDEFDDAPEFPAANVSEAAEIELDAATKIRDFEMLYGIEIPTDAGFETLAGFLLYRLGHIPSPGESVDYDGRRFTVTGIDRNRITRVKVEKREQ